MSPFEKWLVCIGGFRVRPWGVLPLGKEGVGFYRFSGFSGGGAEF